MQAARVVVTVAMLLFLDAGLRAAQPVVSVGKPRLRDIAYSPDGTRLATLTGDYFEFLDADTHARTSRVDSGGASALLYSPDGRLLILLGGRPAAVVLDADDLSTVATLPERGARGRTAFSPDGKLLASASGDAVVLRDTTTWSIVAELSGDDGRRVVQEKRKRAHREPTAATASNVADLPSRRRRHRRGVRAIDDCGLER